MEFILKVGIAKKLGQPNYGSYCASCHMEIPVNIVELGNPDKLETLIRQTYAQCFDSVETELRQRGVVQSNAPAPVAHAPAAPKSSVFGLWLKDQAVQYGQDMATITSLLYRHQFPAGSETGWIEQGKALAAEWSKLEASGQADPEAIFDKILTQAFHSLDTPDDVA